MLPDAATFVISAISGAGAEGGNPGVATGVGLTRLGSMGLCITSPFNSKIQIYPSQNKTGTAALSKSLWSPVRIGSRRDLKSGFHFGTGIPINRYLQTEASVRPLCRLNPKNAVQKIR
jgi:hypothetical protein